MRIARDVLCIVSLVIIPDFLLEITGLYKTIERIVQNERLHKQTGGVRSVR